MTIAATIIVRNNVPENVPSHMSTVDAIHEEVCCASVQRIDITAEDITDAWNLPETVHFEVEQHYFIDDSPIAFVRNVKTGSIVEAAIDFADAYYTAQAERDQEEGVFH